MSEGVKKWAQDLGYDDIVFLKKWKEYNIYAPKFRDKSVYTGTPTYFLEKNNEVRNASEDEKWEIFDSFDDE